MILSSRCLNKIEGIELFIYKNQKGAFMEFIFLVSAIVIILCIASSGISNKYGVPSLLIFIFLGMLFGSDGIFKIHFDNYVFAERICSFSLIFIMFYGGFVTNWKIAKPIIGKAVCLSTLGVILTAALTGVFCYYVLGFDLFESFLLGAVISSTDAASVFSILRSKKLNLKYGTASLLEVESGSNDPASYMLTMIAIIMIGGESLGKLGIMAFNQIVLGIFSGVVIFLFAKLMLKRASFMKDGLDAIFVFAIAVAAYAFPQIIGGNGYLSAYLVGLLLGNSKIKNKTVLIHFFDGITGLSQIAIFFLLGLLAFPSQIPAIFLSAFCIAIFLTFIARPIAIFAILGPAGCNIRQSLLVSWAGLRGAASIVFAIMAVSSGVDTNNDVFHIVFCIALLSVAFQGTLLPWVSEKLDMVDNQDNVLKTFNDYQEDTEMQLIKTYIPESHPWIGKSISEIKLMIDILVVMIKRGDETIIPKGDTIIFAGDFLILSGETYYDDGNVMLSEIKIEEGHPWLNKTLRELELPDETLVMIIKHADGATIIPKGKNRIKEGDILVLSGYES